MHQQLAEIEKTSLQKVLQFEEQMKLQPQVELEIKHHFSYGIYARELFIPAGVILTGKIHKYEQLNILTKGEMLVLIDGRIRRIEAPYTLVAPAGTKRVAKALKDCIWLTIHGTHEIDLDKIEEKFIAQTEQEYLEFSGQLKLLDN